MTEKQAPKDVDLSILNIDEVRKIIANQVNLIFPSDALKNCVSTLSYTGELQVDESTFRSSWSDGCLFYEQSKHEQKLSSLVSFCNQAQLGDKWIIVINQIPDPVTTTAMHLYMYPRRMQYVLSDLLASGHVAVDSLGKMLGEIKELCKEENQGKKVLLSCSLESRNNGEVSLAETNFFSELRK